MTAEAKDGMIGIAALVLVLAAIIAGATWHARQVDRTIECLAHRAPGRSITMERAKALCEP